MFGDESLRNRRNTEAIEIGPGQLAAARIVEHRPAKRRPLDDVRAEVRTRVVAQEAARLARQAGEARLAELKAGKGDTSGLSAPKTIARGTTEGLPPPVLETVYRMPEDSLPAWAGVDLGEAGYTIVQLVKTVPLAADELAKREPTYAPQFERIAAQQDVLAFVDALKARAKIVRHADRLAPPQN